MDERKVVLITGGAMGQGRAHAYKYAENGFDVVLADMQEPTSEAFKETIAHCKSIGAKVLAVRANITSKTYSRVHGILLDVLTLSLRTQALLTLPTLGN